MVPFLAEHRMYLGKGDVFEKASRKFTTTYADQMVLDRQALLDAIESGQIVAEVGV